MFYLYSAYISITFEHFDKSIEIPFKVKESHNRQFDYHSMFFPS